ncbi:MAG TPA: hypothetical protein VHY80_19725 [Stellaceae bacterium]|nr:hypothetical protein [Stellaceae bacterium]
MPAGSIKAIIAALLIALGPSSAPVPQADRLGLPALMLWSWDRVDDLRFIDPADTGVAYLAGAIRLSTDGIAVVPRRNPLLLPPGTATLAVIHITLDRAAPPVLDDTTRDRLIAAIIGLRPPGSAALQIDFEVTQSQQSFLAATIQALRQKLPETKLSMTALSSWCLNESWIDALPVDEVVPMLFRLGPDRPRVAAHFTAGGDFRSPRCHNSFGIATDEARRAGFAAPRLTGRRAYVFAPKRWTAATYTTIRQEIAR